MTAKTILQKLKYLQKDHFQYIFIGDESWYQYYYDFERQWVFNSDELNERAEKINFETKTMIIIFIGVNEKFMFISIMHLHTQDNW